MISVLLPGHWGPTQRLRQANPWQLEDTWGAEVLDEATETDDLEVSEETAPLDVHPEPTQRLTQASPLQEVGGVVTVLEVTRAEELLDTEELEVTELPVLVLVDGEELQPAPMQMLTHPSPSHDVVGAAGKPDVEELETLAWEDVELLELEETVLDVTVVLTVEEGQPRPRQMLTHASPWHDVV